jgi:acyl-CoA thioesterase-1
MFFTVPVYAASNSILIYGDSLSAAYGIPQQQGWVSLLQQRLEDQHYPYKVINASVSGETSSGGLSRLSATLNAHQPNIVILELGANDGLRGLPLSVMKDNLAQMIEQSKRSGAKVLLIGMKIPPNYGPKYSQSFTQQYQQLSQEFKVPRVPFMLQGMENRPEFIQDDGLHPNVQGQPIILENIWPHLKLILKK